MRELDLYGLLAAAMTLSHVRSGLLLQDLGQGRKRSLTPGLFKKIFTTEMQARADDVENRLRLAKDSGEAQIKDALNVALIQLMTVLEEFDLPVTLTFAERFKAGFETSDRLPEEREVGELIFRLLDELRDRRFFGLDKDLGKLFKLQQFPADVRLRFPSAVVDIDEAMNCLALERSTASVFHMMRVMEIAVRAAATCLGVPEPIRGSDKNWGNMLNQIKAAMSAKWPTAADKMQEDFKLFENLYVSLDAVRSGWRNSTMHVERTYTMDDAHRIRHAVEGLLIIMAGRFDENGSPPA